VSNIIEALPLPAIYYQPQTQKYWRLDAQGKWIQLNQDSAMAFIISTGRSNKKDDSGFSEASGCLLDVQSQQNLDYAGPLAGYNAGFYNINGANVLVTESPKLIVPKAGPWPLLEGILRGMFGDDQIPCFYGWLKQSLNCYHSHRWSPGQALAMAGPVCSGKSLLQDLITELFGGRSAKCHTYMTDRTSFNAELFRAEHLMIEDDAESTDYKARRHFGARLKDVAVNPKHYCHGKYKEALSLTPIWRMTISLNDEPGRLMVLPGIEADIADKIMLLKVAAHPMPMPTSTAEQQAAFRQALSAELPAFADFLMHWEIPEALRCPRFGVRHYHHPELLAAISELSPESRFLALIDIEVFRHRYGCDEPWSGTSNQLQERLLYENNGEHSQVAREVERLLYFNSACGAYLGNLALSQPRRVSKRILHGQAIWTIQPPPILAPEEENMGL